MHALITAGGIPQPGEKLHPYCQGQPKALLPLAGRPMLQWVLDALGTARSVERTIVIGLEESSAPRSRKPLSFIPSQGNMIDNIRAGMRKALEEKPGLQHVLVMSSDIPAITGTMVDWVADEALRTEHDIYFAVVGRQVMEMRFPGSSRTYTHLKDGDVCGGDIGVLRPTTMLAREELWRRIHEARKSPVKQAALLGLDTLLLLLTRQATLADAERLVSQRLAVRGRALLCPYAEVAMDIDKPHQLEILRAELERRAG